MWGACFAAGDLMGYTDGGKLDAANCVPNSMVGFGDRRNDPMASLE